MTDRLALLESVFQRECRSLAQYLAESGLWTHRGDRAAQELVRSIMADERRWAEQLYSLIEQRGGVPRPGSYPTAFTDMNLHFVSLDFMLLRLADFLDHEIAAIRSDLSAAANDAALRSLLEAMLERKGGQVTALRNQASTLTAKAS